MSTKVSKPLSERPDMAIRDKAKVLDAVVQLALHWRYDHPGNAQISHSQQLADGGELLTLLREYEVDIPMDMAMKVISAPGPSIEIDSPVARLIEGNDAWEAALATMQART